MEDIVKRTPLSLFYICYNEGDIIGKYLALASQLPILFVFFESVMMINLFFLIPFGKLNILQRSKGKSQPFLIQASWFWNESIISLFFWLVELFIGQVLNESLARVLKSLLKYPRPFCK